MTSIRFLAVAAVVLARQSAAQDSVGTSWLYETEHARFRAEVIASGLTSPSGLSFLPEGRLLITERRIGRLSVMDVATGAISPIDGVPPVHGKVDGGLMDVLVHPDHARNGLLYLASAVDVAGGATTVVDIARLEGTRLAERRRIFTARPVIDNSNEFGARLVLDGGHLFIALGQRDTPALAQDLAAHTGKIVRLREDGTMPSDNPFASRAGALPEIWSYGHRNPQGLAIQPTTRAMWEHEHGPKGGDEVNIIRRGENYGWPVITYGREYDGRLVGAGLTRQAGMAQPVHYYVPSIAPSGMIFHSGRGFPAWTGNVLSGALGLRHLNRLVVDGDRVIHEERLLEDRRWRVRVVQEGPDGSVYLGVDAGLLVRLVPLR